MKECPPILGKDWPYISTHFINKNGSINSNLPKLSGIYAYQLINDPNKLYVGMSIDLSKRHITHVKNTVYKETHSPVFYAAVNKYGWDAFRLIILETTDLVDNNDKEAIMQIYEREQFYFNLCRPCYNVNLIAGPSYQGYIWTPEQSLQQSLKQRGISRPRPDKTGVSFKHSDETKNKIKLRAGGVIVEVYENDILLNSFNSLKKAGEFYNVHYSTIQRYGDTNKLWDNKYLFKLIPKVIRKSINNKVLIDVQLLPLDPSITISSQVRGTVVDILDKDNNLIYKFNTVSDACQY
uniref:GIY-YIG endonuclease n=1 Tax=Parasitella parasitica TaxID=35722 RepID=A0A088S6E2_9FUNG|nr:GIY-YIG endonuclease [Parasitella parasitica]AIO05741.1 GIY-YIG endonuclease [Parasitella parasitica]